jgi:hypothetical protein
MWMVGVAMMWMMSMTWRMDGYQWNGLAEKILWERIGTHIIYIYHQICGEVVKLHAKNIRKQSNYPVIIRCDKSHPISSDSLSWHNDSGAEQRLTREGTLLKTLHFFELNSRTNQIVMASLTDPRGKSILVGYWISMLNRNELRKRKGPIGVNLGHSIGRSLWHCAMNVVMVVLRSHMNPLMHVLQI